MNKKNEEDYDINQLQQIYHESNIHKKISYKIFNFIDKYYYSNLFHKYKNKYSLQDYSINDYLNDHTKHNIIFKPEWLIYFLFYLNYTISCDWTHKNHYSLILNTNIYYIIYKLEEIIRHEYNYESNYNVKTLKFYSTSFFYYIFFFKLYISDNIYSFQKYNILGFTIIFYILMNLQYAYIKRLDIIKNKKDPNKYQKNKLFIITSNVKTMKKIVYHTRHFVISNFIFFLNILIFLFL